MRVAKEPHFYVVDQTTRQLLIGSYKRCHARIMRSWRTLRCQMFIYSLVAVWRQTGAALSIIIHQSQSTRKGKTRLLIWIPIDSQRIRTKPLGSHLRKIIHTVIKLFKYLKFVSAPLRIHSRQSTLGAKIITMTSPSNRCQVVSGILITFELI